MCFASSEAPVQPMPPQYEYFMKDAPDTLVAEGTRHAQRRLKAPITPQSILGDWSGNDASANAPGDDGGSGSASP